MCLSFSDLLPPGVCNLLNPSTIYANNEVNLHEVDIYGFDYDYTLALYSNALHSMIYDTARDFLIESFKVGQFKRRDVEPLFCLSLYGQQRFVQQCEVICSVFPVLETSTTSIFSSSFFFFKFLNIFNQSSGF